jgi:hypothetical protein
VDNSSHTADEKSGRRAQRPAWFRRALVLVALLLGCATVYGLILARFDLSKNRGEIEAGTPLSDARVNLYLQPIQIDVVNESIQVRISVLPVSNGAPTIADHDFLLEIGRGNQVEYVRVTAGQSLPEVTYEFDLHDGDVRNYPLDTYSSLIALRASERTAESRELVLPIHVTAWEAVLGFDVRAKSIASQQGGELRIQYMVRRTGAVSFFGLAIYTAMFVMMVCALIIGSLVFLGIRKIEVTLVGALGAMIFALPALRNAMPGAPPLGVRADILVFFWAELGVVIALCLFIAAWVRKGSGP